MEAIDEEGYDVDVLLLIDDMNPTGMLTLDGRVHVTDMFDNGGGDRGPHYYQATKGVEYAIGGVAYAIDAVLLPDDVNAAMMIPETEAITAEGGADDAPNTDTDIGDYWGGMSDGTVFHAGDDSLADGEDGISRDDFFVATFPIDDDMGDDVEENEVDDEYDGEEVDDGLAGGRHREHVVDGDGDGDGAPHDDIEGGGTAEDETDDYFDGENAATGDDDFFDESPSVDNYVDDAYFVDMYFVEEDPAWDDLGIGGIIGGI